MKMDIFLRILGEAIFLKKKKAPDISCYRTQLWNMKLFFVYCDLLIKIPNLFSLSCSLWSFSSNSYLLPIARYNEYINEKPIPVVGLPKAWVCPFACWDWGWNPAEGVEFCLFWMLFVVRCRSQSMMTGPEDSTECAVWVLSGSLIKREAMNRIRTEAPQKENDCKKGSAVRRKPVQCLIFVNSWA